MRTRAGMLVLLAVLGAVVIGALASFAVAQSGGRNFSADRLRGSFEIPAVSTVARGEFEATVNTVAQTITYELSYTGLEGTVTQAHIHFGQNFANGGIVAWLCETATNNSTTLDTQCPQSGTVTGTITPAQVTDTGAQRIGATQFDELVAAMRAGLTYANIHTNTSPGGEIRAQIRRGGGGDDDD